jgi:autotransporter-associated beta strand protein
MRLRQMIRLYVLTAGIVLVAASVQAANITMNASDVNGLVTSFNGAGQWSNAAAPSAGNDYFTGDFILRTPADGNSYTFGGNSLTVNNTNGYPQGLLYKGTGNTGVVTVNNLILNGGYVSHANGTGDLFQLDGNINVVSNSFMRPKQGAFNVLADISGSANITVDPTDGAGRILRWMSPSNTFTGSLINNGRFELVDDARMNFVIGASGVNNAISGTGPEAIIGGDFVFNLTGASTTPGSSWNIVSASNLTYGVTFNVPGFTQSGDFWTNGTFLFNPLTGTLSVSAPPIAWNVNGGGNWNVGANWVGNAVPGAGADVAFGTVLTAENAPANINLNVNANVTRISFTGTNQYIISGANTLILSGLAQVSASSGTHEVGAIIAGNSGLTKTGGGDVILSANNTYTGTTNIQQGGLRVRNTGAVDGAVDVSAGATLFFEGDTLGGGFNGTFANSITGAGGVATSADMTTEVVTFNNAKAYTGQTTVNNGTLQITGAGTLGTSDGTAATRTLVDGNESTGKLALAGVSVANEVLVLEARELAALEATHLTSSGASSWSGNIKGEAGGTQYNIESTSGTLTIGGTISAPDTGARNFVFGGAGNVNLTGKLVDLVSNADGAIVGTPVNALNNVNLIKRGTGTTTIGTASALADDYWRGTTVVEGGTLQVLSDGANNGELRTSSMAVQAGATLDVDHFGSYTMQVGQDLSGGGTIHAQAMSVFGDSLVSPGDNGVGTLTFQGAGGAGGANLYLGSDFLSTVGARGGLAFDLAGATTVGGGVNDLITGVNNLTLDVEQYADDFVTPEGTDAPIEVLVTLADNQLAGGNPGSYRLINYSGSLTNTANTTVSFAPQLQGVGQTRQSIAVSTATPGQVNLVVTGSVGNQTWTGSSSNIWNINSAPNWSGTGNVYFDLDRVTFSDSAGANDTVDIQENVVPGLVTFTSATGNTYTMTGIGGIGGNADVNLTGNVTAAVATTGNSNLGDVSIATGATLQAGNGTSTGFTDVAGVVSGAGAVRVASGSLQLNGTNTYTGVTTVTGGTLLINSADALGAASGNTVVNGGTVRANGATYTLNEPIMLNGGAFAVGGGGPAALTVASNYTVGTNGGTIQIDGNTGADGLTVTGNIVGTSSGAFNANVDGGSTMTVSGNVTNNGPLNKTGGGTLALTGTASVTSPTINVNGGNLDVTGLTSTFTVGSGRTLNANATVTGPVIGANGSIISGSGTYSSNVTAQTGATVRVGGAGLASFANQFVVDDFESYGVGDVVNVATPPWTAHAATTAADIEDAGGGNQVLSYGIGGTTGGLTSGTSRAMPTSSVISAGETATVFFRLNPRTDDPDHSFGLADIAETGAQNFGNFEVQVAALQGTAAGAFNLAVRNGGAGATVVAPNLPIDTWYNVWMVVDRTTNTFDVYMNTGTGAATVANRVADNFSFRNGASPGPLNVLLGLSNTAPIDSGVRYDDVYYLNGEALNNPLAGLLPGSFFESQTMTVQGDLSLNVGTTLALDIASPSALDTLNVAGTLAAAGSLSVSLTAGAPAPQLGNTFNILDFGAVTGSFSSISLPSLTAGLAWDTSALLTTGILSVITGTGTPGDFDNDGDVDGRDFLVWQRGGSPNPLSAGDLATWQANYGAGSLVAAATSVPEPATWLGLVTAAMSVLSLWRR